MSDIELAKLTAKLNSVTKLGTKVMTSTPTSAAVPPHLSSASLSTIQPGSATQMQTPRAQIPPVQTSTPAYNEADSVLPGVLPSNVQEYALCQDLLYILLALDGKLMRKIPGYMSTLLSFKDVETPLFALDESVDASLASMAGRFIPIASYYAFVTHTVDSAMAYHYGYVVHAMAAQTRQFLHDYHLFVAQLERQINAADQTIGLQQVWSWTVEVGRTMRYLAELWHRLIFHVKNPNGEAEKWIRGGEALNVLYQYMTANGGDRACRDVVKQIVEKAAVPYMTMLAAWITRGEIQDPYNEFMILERRTVRKEDLRAMYNDSYWESRYRIRGDTRGTDMPVTSLEELRLAFQTTTPAKDLSQNEFVPYFLKGLEDNVLAAGKYLNVVRECGLRLMDKSSSSGDAFSMAALPDRIERCYKFANTQVLHQLFKEHRLLPRLRSVKHFFFADQGDFLVHFVDAAYAELRKPAQEISLTKLQSLLDLVLRNPSSSSAACMDPYKEDVKVDLSTMGLTEQLLRVMSVTGALEDEYEKRMNEIPSETTNRTRVQNGFNSFMLDYNVPFPVSLVLSRKALTRYQIIFRYIFTCKYVERQLANAWAKHQTGYKLYTKWRVNPGNDFMDEDATRRLDQVMMRAYDLRSQMLLFVQNLIYYVFNEVLQQRWADFEQQLMKADTVDEVLRRHSDFLDTCLKECMLTNKKLLMVSLTRRCIPMMFDL
jgi:gamma-tubulin complex component 2